MGQEDEKAGFALGLQPAARPGIVQQRSRGPDEERGDEAEIGGITDLEVNHARAQDNEQSQAGQGVAVQGQQVPVACAAMPPR